MNVRAMFIDMDGTLLKSSNDISRRNIEAINRLIHQGVKVFLATGRHYEITAPYHKKIGLQTPMICLNGATIHAAETGKVMQMKTVRVNEERFHHLTGDDPCNVIIHTANGLYCKETNEEIDYWTKVGQLPPRYIGDLRQANYQDVLKYSVRTGTPSPKISALFKKEAEVIDWNDGFEMVAPNTSKWSAIKSLLTEFRISPDDVVAIGDGPNDIEMLRHVSFGVAMGNASEKVKAAADFVTGHHENDGLAEFIECYLLKSHATYAI
ncbi:HAD family hydrolase [Siminovitchia acidinfaciens]|uniref:HAD family hydrolase n=1 Tax=Siminovitchia acidinfaciens TaxID=2321395 RepID=A0A429Y3Z3_9BACI|nr:HAD family hydrolase [Siminovitchia acidinfaciens]RST76135.1 HAD family hydrolase [Siminovitchia acidinfaciens]